MVPKPPKVGDWITLDGGKYVVESFDTDDSFPPAVASYELKDGAIFYRGRNGSEGVVSGTPEEAEKWMREVREWIKREPPEDNRGRPWTEADGGAENVKAALDMVTKTAAAFGIQAPPVNMEVVKRPLEMSAHAASGSISLVNSHQREKETGLAFESDVSREVHVAAHETAHAAYAASPESPRYVEELKRSGQVVSVYHNFAGAFEGLMDLGAAYVHSPDKLKAYSPKLYDIADRWAAEVRGGQNASS